MMAASIRARLLVSIAAIQMVGAGLGTYLVVEHERHQAYVAFDASLGEQAAVLRSLVEAPDEAGDAFVFHKEFMALPRGGRFLLTDADGKRIAGSDEWPMAVPVGSELRSIVNLRMGDGQYRALMLRKLPVVDVDSAPASGLPTLNLMYAAPTARVEAHIRRVEAEAIVVCLGLLGMCTAISGWALTKALRPLRRLAEGAEKIDVGQWDLAEMEEGRRFSELRPLADALSGLVDRLHTAFVRERQFFGDAAHEMKSSVAIVRSTLQYALQKERSAAEYRTELEGALGDTGRLQSLVGGMLDLARIESIASVGVEAGRTEAHAGVQRVMERLHSVAAAKGVRIELVGERREVWVAIGEEDFLSVLGNVIENAVQNSDEGGAVSVAIWSGVQGCQIDVSDQGCGVAEAAVPYIFDRFYRGDASRSRGTGGVGLGLSIAKALVVRAGGTISVRSEEGKGAVFSVFLKGG